MINGYAGIYNTHDAGWGWVFDIRDKNPKKWRNEGYKTMHEAYVALLKEMTRIMPLNQLNLDVQIRGISLKEDSNKRQVS